jgi:hypothetical protein
LLAFHFDSRFLAQAFPCQIMDAGWMQKTETILGFARAIVGSADEQAFFTASAGHRADPGRLRSQ